MRWHGGDGDVSGGRAKTCPSERANTVQAKGSTRGRLEYELAGTALGLHEIEDAAPHDGHRTKAYA